jgi:hypothetical protein
MATTDSDDKAFRDREAAGLSAARETIAPSRFGKIVTMALGATLFGVLYNADRRIRWMNSFHDLIVGAHSKRK